MARLARRFSARILSDTPPRAYHVDWYTTDIDTGHDVSLRLNLLDTHRGKAGETGRRNGPIDFIDSSFLSLSLSLSLSLPLSLSLSLSKQLRRPPGRSGRRALLALPTIARKTPNAKRDGCFHDRDNFDPHARARSEIFILIRASAARTTTIDFRSRVPARLSLLLCF